MNDKKSIGEKVRALGLAQSFTYEEARRYLSGGITDQLASVQDVLKPLESVRQQLDAFIHPYPDAQAALAAVGGPYESYREAAEKAGLIDTLFRNVVGADTSWARDQMERLTGGAKSAETVATMSSLFSAGSELFSSRATAASYLGDSRALMAAAAQNANLLSSYKAISADVERFLNPQGAASLRSYWESLVQVDTGFVAEPVPTEYGRSTEVGTELITLVQGVAKEISIAQTQHEAADRIVLAIEGIKEPLYQKLLLSIFYPFLLALLFSYANPYVDFHVKKSLEGASTQSANKQVKEAARDAVGDLQLLRDYRFVTAQSLAVRAEPKARGQALGQLRLGQTVHVLGKERDFTLVIWRSEDGNAQLQGWVFSRYLKRFQ